MSLEEEHVPTNEPMEEDEAHASEEDEGTEETIPENVNSSEIIKKPSLDYNGTISQDCSNRFEYLLKQTEIFSHFMTFGKDQPVKAKPGRKPKPKQQEVDVNDHRHRKTEEEEDAELLEETKKAVNLFR